MRYDGIVIGGGAAGMFAAITAAKRGQNVLLLEKNDRLGRKLLITGKGRCNVTNNCTGQEVLQNVPRNGRFLYSAMTAFPPEKTMAFFEERGCRLKTERGNRVFPVTDKSQSILDCLQSELHRQKITVKTARVRDILTQDGHVTGVRTQNEEIAANWVILATGGASSPATGSTGGKSGAAGDGGKRLSGNAGAEPAERGGQAAERQGKGAVQGLWRAAVYPLWHFRPHGAVGELPPERRRLPSGAGFEARAGR